MKIAVMLDNALHAGGGFQQALNAAIQIKRICSGAHELIIYTSIKSNVEILQKYGIDAVYVRYHFSDRILAIASDSRIFAGFINRFKLVSNLERRLKNDKVDLTYFLSPSNKIRNLASTNYVVTVWDLCHRDFPEFPEVREFGEFESRESLYMKVLPKAYMIIADSPQLKEKIIKFYNVNPERINVMPFQPMQSCRFDSPMTADNVVADIYGLEDGYLFYPAQFWSHKNHVRILEALCLYREAFGNTPVCVFSGGDAGNYDIVNKKAASLGLQGHLQFLGYVPSEHIPSLYRAASALVMPTYFGPTNLPPLEAMALGTPIIYPRHLQNQCGSAALYFDVDDPHSLYQAIVKILQTDISNDLSKRGYEKMKEIDQVTVNAENQFRSALDIFEKRLSCWRNS